MFEVGYSEIFMIAIVLIVVVGPKDLPKMLRAFGKTMTKFRQMSGDFQRQFNDALKEAELDEVSKSIADMRKLDPRSQVREVLNPLRDAGNALKADLNKSVQKPIAPAQAEPISKVDEIPAKPSTTKTSKRTGAKASTKAPVAQRTTKGTKTGQEDKPLINAAIAKQTKGKTNK